LSLRVTVVEDRAGASGVRGLGSWLARTAPRSARGEVTIAIVPDAKMRALNRRFRGKDKVTDVLSFPAEETGTGVGFPPVEGKRPSRLFIGEIVIAGGLAGRQARSLDHPLGVELRILSLHGLLHLLGYDHEVDNGEMARAEARLRRRAGLPAGLIARSS